MIREYDIKYIYADETPKLKAMLQSVEGRQWVSTSIHEGRERWKFCRFYRVNKNNFGEPTNGKKP